MPLIAIKEGNKTIYRHVENKEDKEAVEKDLTTSDLKIFALNIPEEKYNKIFRKK